jgi:hypothetical protein
LIIRSVPMLPDPMIATFVLAVLSAGMKVTSLR